MVYGELAAVSTPGSVLSYVSAKSKDATGIFSEIIISKENTSIKNSSVKDSVKYAVAYDSAKYFFTKYDTECSFPVKYKPRSCTQLIEHSKGEKLDGFKFIAPFEILNPVGKALSNSVYEISFQTNALEGEFNISFGDYVLDPGISACGTLPADEHITYELTQNISFSGDGACIVFGADYQTLDCKGFSINAVSGTNTGIDVLSGNDFENVKNCNIIGFTVGLKIAGSEGVYQNINITESRGYFLYINSNKNNLTNINLTCNTTTSSTCMAAIYTSENSFLNSNTIDTSSGNYATFCMDGGGVSSNSFINNTFSSIGKILYILNGATTNNFLNNTFSAQTWVHDVTGGNFFNNSFTGNKYVFDNGTGSWQTCNITDTTGNGYADIGSDLPFNDANTCMGSYWSGLGEDYHPWTGLSVEPIIVSQYATRTGNRFNVTISSATPLLIANYTYLLPASTTAFLYGSFYTSKISGANSNLHLAIILNGVTTFNQSIVSFLSSGDFRTISLPKSPTNVSSSSTNNLQIYAWSSAGSPIGLYDVGIGLTFSLVSNNQTNISYGYGAINTQWLGTANTNLSFLLVNNSAGNSDLYASYYGVINASGATIISAHLLNNVTKETSPFMSRSLTSSSDSGVLAGSWIFKNVSSTQIILVVNSTAGVTVSWVGNKFNKNYNNSQTVIQNAKYAASSPISIGAGYTVILNKTLTISSSDTTGVFIESSNTFFRLGSNPVVEEKCEAYNNSVLYDTKTVIRTMSSASNTCNPKIVMFARYASDASLFPNNITVVCSARNIGSGTVNLISAGLVLHELKEINLTYIPKPPIVAITAPDNGSSLMGNYSINWSTYSLFPITSNLTLTNTSGYSVNVNGMNASNTSYIIDTAGYNIGLWIINISANNAYGTGSDQISVYYTITTTTTTTSTSSTSTTTPGALPANSTLYIFSILAPILATIFTLCALCGIGKGILPSLFASTLWYASSMFSTRIRFIDDFTVSMSEHYVDAGNWEVGTLFLAFAGIMALYAVVLVLDFIYSSNKQNG
jgi:hypothetical protein